MKPVGKSQGKGIFLFKELKDIQDWNRGSRDRRTSTDIDEVETYIAQRYIERPLLIGGKKFDMRIFVLVTSYVPLKAWVYREGFARFSGTRYSVDHIEDTFVHLTNTAIQKTAPDYNPDRGAKWPLMNLRRYLSNSWGTAETDKAFRRINEVFFYSLKAVQELVHIKFNNMSL
jgi:tubulin polyglutamylase TTLL9